MRLAYLGNFGPAWSTENHVSKAFQAEGHEVVPIQENADGAFLRAAALGRSGDVDFVLWTRTGWNPPIDAEVQHGMILGVEDAGRPVVGLHLDRWWGLDRQGQVLEEPFFQSTIVITADGGHDEEWLDAGINHVWMPPAVLGAEAARRGRKSARLGRRLAWVGSWEGYHPEWPRLEYVEWLRARYNGRLEVWPKRGGIQIRGQRLNDLYASVAGVAGDSCLAPNARGGPMTRYWSDRIPETLGRGGYLVHPWVEGLDDHFDDGVHLDTYPLGDWDRCGELLDAALADTRRARGIAAAGQAHVLEHHTYEVRARAIVDLVGAYDA